MKKIFLEELTLDELLTAIEAMLDEKLKLKEAQKSRPVYLSRQEVADILKITLPTLRDYTRLGWLNSYKIGARVLYKEDEVVKSIECLKINKHRRYRKYK